jgi:ParB family protein of integrating conjugative element (PFGI_1 class)
MATKTPSADQVRNVLGAGYFGNNREIQPQDPLDPTPMRLPIDQIDPFDRNPRRSKNPEYDSILESLRANGQEEALTVTRRPGSERYMIKRGGNTRLAIMKMLVHEAGDSRFEIIDCLFMPWTSESDCIIGHLNENTTQGRMTLIDKARGYRDFKLEYEQENGVELGQRKLAELLKQKGASVNTPLLGSMNYALDVLEPAIPLALASGMGKPMVERLKRLDQTFQCLAKAHQLFDDSTRDAQITAEFSHILSELDGPDFDASQATLEITDLIIDRIREQAPEVSIERLKYDIDECLKGDPWKVPLMSTLIDSQEDNNDSASPETSAPIPSGAQQPGSPGRPSSASPAAHAPAPPQQINAIAASGADGLSPAGIADTSPAKVQVPPQQQSQPAPVIQPPSTEQRLTPPPQMMIAGNVDLKSMRARIYTLALKFAKSVRVDRSLTMFDWGYGYFLDIPKPRLNTIMTMEQAAMDPEYKMTTRRFSKDHPDAPYIYGWWLLWIGQGLTYFEENTVPGYDKLPESNMKMLMRHVYDPMDERLFTIAPGTLYKLGQHVGGLMHPMDLSMAFNYIRAEHTMRYVEFLEARTQMAAYVEANDINVWEE